MTQPAQTVIAVNGRIVSGAPSAPRPIGGPVTVNGEVIPPAAIRAEAQNHSAPKGKPAIAWRKAARALVIRTLLLQEARRLELEAEPAELDPGRFETAEEALIRQVLERVTDGAPPTMADARVEWARDPSRFRAPPLWEVSHILCACDPRDAAARDKALGRAQMLAKTVHGKPQNFADIARRESDCGSRANGGALGQLGPGDSVPEFEAALRDLGDGEIAAEPVLTRHGWHIIRMDALAKGRVLPFEAVCQTIVEALEKAAWNRATRQFVDRLVRSATIAGADLAGEQDHDPPNPV